MNYKILNIKGALLDTQQLEDYLRKIASGHVLQDKSNKYTYPIPRLKENFEFITEVYNLLNEHIKLKLPIHPAGEWILDNFYIIDETVKTVTKELTLKKYTNFLGIANGPYAGFARIYVLASEIVAYTDGKINGKNLEVLLKAYEDKKTLSMDEIWNINTFLRVALIENIREACEKIYSAQLQKYKVENIIERLVENKSKDELQFKNIGEYKTKVIEQGEMKYPFIEYMSYRLKQYGKKAYPFLNILEEQVNKMGTEISEVIKKEHFDIAVRKVSVGNCIISIKNINRINMIEIFEKINGVEEVLKKDPVNVYSKMDYKTRIYYRNKLKEISKKTKISEIYIARKCLELSSIEYEKSNMDSNNKKAHVGYYLIADGEPKLLEILQNKKVPRQNNMHKAKKYITALAVVTIVFAGVYGLYINTQINNIVLSLILSILLLIPIETIFTQIAQYILGKTKNTKIIPKLDFRNGIPEQNATFVVIPTIIKNGKRVEELMHKLEVYYIANKSDNIYFALLGDCSTSSNEEEGFDEEVINTGKKMVDILNKKYPDEKFTKFNFIYRKRMWNEGEEAYLGWERKRGLLNQFNEYILGNISNPFKTNTITNVANMPPIKYIITLDADTDLVLNSAKELTGAMAHILNKPELNKSEDLVIAGHALIQPRIGIDLMSSIKSLYTKIYAGAGGVDVYANAISDIYQDNFEEGIFTGKGIYDLKIFSKILNNEIPENTILSHDLLEGSYLRCGLATDIMLMDGYPVGYNSSKSRLHRWIRGDWQIIIWLKDKIKNKRGEIKNNPLNILSKYKIFDNLVRSLLEVSSVLTIIYMCILDYFYKIKIWPIITTVLIAVLTPTVIDVINKIVFKREGEKRQKTFNKTLSGINASLLRGLFTLATLPDKAYMSANAICKTLYRLKVSKKHMLEWVTAEEAEKMAKKDIKSYYINMAPNIILGILGILYIFINAKNPFSALIFVISLLWLIAPAIMCYISKEIVVNNKKELLVDKDKQYVLEVGKRTWQFFKDYLVKENNYLPPDNYQEDRKPKAIKRTSSTNIGLALLAVISSYDLGYETQKNTLELLNKMIDTIYNLQKWNGHLYNWYNIETLEPLRPRYISSVDSGNFVGYLYVVKQFLIQNGQEDTRIDELIEHTDFTKLYNEKMQLFSVGYNVEENMLTDSYYDLLASEARQTSLVAIAKKDIEQKHWYNLSRTLTVLNKYKGLISWSGTAFEYLMPNINIPKYPGSLLDESCKFLIMSQKEYNKKLKIPWGISESAFNLKDLNNNYQYKAFGIPWLGLKRGLADEIVVAPYASMMAIIDEPIEVLKNLKQLEKLGMYNKYGFYESIDYTPTRLRKNETKAIVKTYMAHHQGLILLSINNLMNNNIVQKRFVQNPEIEAVDILLQERMPENIIITKEEKEKVEKIKYIDYENTTQREITKINTKLNNVNVIGNDKYTIIMDQKGNGYSKYNNILINRYKYTDDEEQGIFFFFKNIKTKRIWTSNYMNYLSKADKYVMCFTPDMNKITRQDGNIETITKISVAPTEPVEIRRIELVNHGIEDETIEITSFLEPLISEKEQDYAHRAFNKLFLEYEIIEDTILIRRKSRDKSKSDMFLAVNLYAENEIIGETEFEVDKEKFYGREAIGLPKTVESSIPLGRNIGLTTEPIVAIKNTVKIKANEKVAFNLIMCVSESKEKVIELINKFTNSETIKRNIELAKVKVEAESRYLNIKGKEIDLCQKILGYLIFPNPLKRIINKNKKVISAYVSELWKYGISGDLPILLVKVKDISDIEILKQVINVYEYLRVKNINIDLVIVDEEQHSYENYTREGIINIILNKNMGYLQNIRSGIFVLNNLSKEEIQVLEFRANLVLDVSLGKIERQLTDLEEEYIETIKQIGDEKIPQIAEEPEQIRKKLEDEQLKYCNEYGGFSPDGKEYNIRINKDNKLPTVWSHVLANEKFGTVVTENMGGYTWYKNSRLNRLTAWANNPTNDIPSEIIYLEDMENKKVWSLGQNPIPDSNDYYITYGFGYANYMHKSNGLIQNASIFVPCKDSAKVHLIRLENIEPRKRKIKLVYYIKPVLGEDETISNTYLNLEYKEGSNLLCLENISNEDFKNVLYVSSSEKINSYTGNKDFFIGNGTIANPDGIHKLDLDRQNSLWRNGILAIEFQVELQALESKEISIVLGAEESIINCQDNAYKYGKISNVKEEYKKVKEYWEDITGKVHVKTPVESMNILLNGWLIYQTISARLLARSGYYQSGGAFGFRDQLQDTIALKYINPEIMKNQIIKHSSHQFIEGDVEHWWHDETRRGIRTRFSDDLLWLAYITEEYINFTGDYTILDIKTNYIEGADLEEGTDEKYDKYLPSKESGTIYEHCKKAIEKKINLGENDLPTIGSGDWNDGFSTVGNKGKGESIWLGFFLSDILKKFIPLCKYKGEDELEKKYEEILNKLKKALNTTGWDGRWYRRAFTDKGEILR
jgi:cyclic beta-1,2-glucan synthetase